MPVGDLAFALESNVNRRRYWQILTPLRLDRTSCSGHFAAVLLGPASRARADSTIAHYARLIVWIVVREQLPISEADDIIRYNHCRPRYGFVMNGPCACGLVWHRRLLDDMKERASPPRSPGETLGSAHFSIEEARMQAEYDSRQIMARTGMTAVRAHADD